MPPLNATTLNLLSAPPSVAAAALAACCICICLHSRHTCLRTPALIPPLPPWPLSCCPPPSHSLSPPSHPLTCPSPSRPSSHVPSSHVLQHSTYKAPFSCDLVYQVEGMPEQRLSKRLGSLPIMLKSKACYLRNLSRRELVERKVGGWVGGCACCCGCGIPRCVSAGFAATVC